MKEKRRKLKRTAKPLPAQISLSMMRKSLYSAVVLDALDSLGYRNQSPRVSLRPLTVDGLLVGRCKTTLWADMFHEDLRPYELELRAVFLFPGLYDHQTL